MRRSARIIAVGLVLAGIGVATFAWLLYQDPDRFRPQLAALLTESAGAPVILQGPMRWSMRPALTLEVAQVSIKAPSLTVRIERLAAKASAAGLLRGDLRLQRLLLADVSVDLAQPHTALAPGPMPNPSQLPLDRLEIENLRLLRNGQSWFAIERVEFDGAAREADVPVAMIVDGTLRADGRLRVDGEQLRLRDAVMRTPAGELSGTLEVDFGARPPRLSARLRSERLTITAQQRVDPSARLIPRVALDLAVLQSIDAELELAVATLDLGKLQLQDVVLPASLRHGHLQFTTTARLSGGSLAMSGEVRSGERHWRSAIQLSGANAGQLLALFGLDRARDGGVANLEAALDADGGHSDELLNSLRGDVSLRLSDVSIDAGASKMIGADVLIGLTHLIRGTEAHPIDLRCAVADFKVRDGLLQAKDTLGAQTAVSNLLGGGVISLPQERMDLVVRPWPREGLGLSVTALSGAVLISGPLLSPQLALTDEAVWRSSATAGAAIFTAGLSLLAQGLLERARGDTPCEEAMGQQKIERGSKDVVQSVSESSSSVAKSVSEGTDNVAQSLRESVQGLGQSLKGLFGGGSAPPPHERPEIE